MRISEPILYFSLGLLASGLLYCVGKRAVAPIDVHRSSQLRTGGELKVSDRELQRAFSETLPALAPKAHILVEAGQEIQVRSNLGSEWELNLKAPAWFALFKQVSASQSYLQVQEISPNQFNLLDFHLAPLSAGVRYNLQGTLYLCKKGDHGVCAQKSYSYEVEPVSPVSGVAGSRVILLR
jgi:hypothetical protein